MRSIYKTVWLLLVLGVIACSPKQRNDDKQVFRYNESSGIVSLDPAFAKDLPHIWVCYQLFNGLVALNERMEVVPAIAHSWQISEDGKEYTFHLRTDVRFHSSNDVSNRCVVASDFEYSFNRLIDPKLASPGSWIMEQVERNADGSLSVKALNDSTLSIILNNAFPPFLGILSMSYASVVSIESIDQIRTNPIGTGPFKFQYWKPGVKLVLLKNESYFESSADFEIPRLDAVSVSFLIDRQTAFMEFIKGNFEYMSGIDARYKDELLNRDGSLRNKYQSSISIIREPFMNTEYVGFFIGEEEQKSTEALMFRKAVNMAVDREKMLRFLRNNVGKPGHGGMIPFGMPGHDPEIGYRYNLPEVTKIIDTYDLQDKKLTISTTAEYVDLMKFIQSQLQDVGIEVVIEVMPAATMRELRANGQLEAFRASWVADYPDAENYLSLFLSRNESPAGPNYTHFSDSIFDISYTQAMGESSIADREKAYRRLDSMVMQQAPVMVLYYDEVLRFVHKSVKGLGSNPTNLLDLRFVSIERNASE